MRLTSMLLTAATALMLTAAPALASPPKAVVKHATTNRLYTRPVFTPGRSYSGLLKMPAPRYINMAEPGRADMQLPDIVGGMLDSESWTAGGSQNYGLYQLPKRAGESFVFIRSEIYPNGGGVEAEGNYYSCEVEESGDGVSIIIRTYDTETWRNTRSFSPGDYSFIATDVAYDPLSGQIFGCLWDTTGSGYMFGTIDYVNGVTKKIRALENQWNAIAIDTDGTIYAIDQEMEDTGVSVNCKKSTLYKVDRNNGAMTPVGDTGLLPYYASSAVIDPRTGRMFWSVTPKDDSQSALYEVNKSTGACTLVYRYPGAEQFMGMYIPAPLAEDGAPAAPANISTDFSRGSLSGKVSFDVPALTYAGAQGSGDISYSIYANGNRVAQGATSWGTRQSCDVTLARGGETELVVTLSNSVGSSPKEKVTIFAGTDVPKAPTVTAEWKAGTMTVSWTTPDGSENGGYIDPAALTYKVTRYPDNIVVAGAATGNSFSESIAEPAEAATYYYTVEATYDRKTSAPGTSNRVVLGASAPPYSIDFSQVDNLDDVTVINVDPDSKGFTLSGGCAYLGDDRMLEKDDWLITTPLRLVPGTVYAVTVLASSQGERYPEYVEVKCGSTNTAEAMKEEVIGRTKVSTSSANAWQTLTGYISTDTERTVFVGVHACSPADVYNLRVASISVSGAFASSAPGAPSDFTVTPDAEGARNVEISLKAPTIDYDGNTLSAITRLCIYRDGEEIDRTDNPAPGTALSYIDNSPELTPGVHTYSAIAYRDNDPGREVKATVYVGIGIPAAVKAVSIVEGDTPGEVTLSWEAVSADNSGYPLNPALVSYSVYKPNASGTAWQLVESGVKGTVYKTAEEPDKQFFTGYAVQATTLSGQSNLTSSDFIAIGRPFTLPYLESFAGGTISTLYTYTGTTGDWDVVTNNPEHLAQADDNGFAKMTGEYYGSSAALISGKIDLTDAQNPILSFSTFNYYTQVTGPDYNNIDVYVCERGGEWVLEKSVIVNNAADQNRWGIVSVDLNKYAGKTIQLMFNATNYSYDTTTIDQIRIASGVDHNLTIGALSAPDTAEPNSSFALKVKVENTGLKDATEFSVELYRDGKLLASRSGDALRAGRQAEFSFDDSFSALVEEDVEYYATVVYSPDMVPADNTTSPLCVKPVLSALPTVSNLRGELSQGMAVLSWDEPDTESATADPITESFEAAEGYATTGQCGWTFVDADGAVTQDAEVSLGTYYLYPNEPGFGDGSPMSWGVLDFDSGFASHYSKFQGRTGSKSLVALANDMYVEGARPNDDWAISPELYGGAQTITFWAHSLIDDPEWGIERFEILYSTTDTDIDSFTKISDESICNTEWQKFTFSVPEGARHFAIRYIANDTYSMFMDDFSFIPAGLSADLSLLGYHIYRNSGRITGEPHGDTEYTDGTAEAGTHSYVVTALYDKGESRPSNAVSLETSGYEAPGITNLRISADARTITVAGAEGTMVSVTAADGRTLSAERASGIFRHTVAAPGVYIVTAGNTSVKLVVK